MLTCETGPTASGAVFAALRRVPLDDRSAEGGRGGTRARDGYRDGGRQPPRARRVCASGVAGSSFKILMNVGAHRASKSGLRKSNVPHIDALKSRRCGV